MQYYVYIPNGNQSGYILVASTRYKDDAEAVMNTYSTAYISHNGDVIAHVGDIPELGK